MQSSTVFIQTRANLPAAVFACLVVLLSLLSLSAWRDAPVLGIGVRPLQGSAQELTWVMPGGYAAEAGLHPGDVVRPVAAPLGSDAWLVLEVTRGQRAGDLLRFARRWPVTADLILLALGLEFLVAGLMVYLRASDRPAALRFALLSGACAATLVAFPAIGNGHPWALALEWVGSKAGMAGFVLFFLTTPVPRWSRFRRLMLWAPLPILAFYFYTVLVQPGLYSLFKLLGYGYMATGMVTGVAGMVWPFLTRAPMAQRRLWPVALGSGLAAVIYLVGSLIPYLLFRRYLLPPELALIGLALLPLGFLWAMLRYPVMGMSLGRWAVMRTVFETITDPIFVVGPEGQLVDASRAGLELLGIPKVRQATEPFQSMAERLEISEVGKVTATGSLLVRALAGQEIRDQEHELRLPGGETAWMSVAATPLFNERGEVEMAVLVYRDITERKRREQERLELDRQKDEFLANLSHDLRTPLTAIKHSVGVVLANVPVDIPRPLRRLLNNVDVAADRMSSLVEDLLELSRLQAGRVQLQLNRCDLRELALRSAAAIEPLAASRKQRLELELPSEPVVAMADGLRLERALTNLLSNAHQYGKPGGTIRLHLGRDSEQVLFAVIDDGPGIPESERSRIFERFYRGQNSNSPTSGGSGLGLPIARAMVDLHGGRMWVESSPGAGSSFWIALPARQPVSASA